MPQPPNAGFELKAGPPIEVIVILNAGLLAVTAPGGDFLELFSAKKDIYGKQQSVAYTYGESWQLTVPAGDYVLKVKKTDGSETETPADGQGRGAYGSHGELTGTGIPTLGRGRSSIAYRPAGRRPDPRRIGAVRRLRGRAADRLHRRHRLRRAALCRSRSGR